MKETSHPPPGSKLLGFFCCSTERKTHKRRDREAQKLGISKARSTKEKRGEEEDTRPGR